MNHKAKYPSITLGLTIFSMFFGAGNLMFPAFIGAQYGPKSFNALLLFSLSAVLLTVLGMASVLKHGGFQTLANNVHTKFSIIFMIVVYILIGPALAIPRAASLPYEIALKPLFINNPLILPIYSALFFLFAGYLAYTPEKLTHRLGKIMGPLLLLLIALLTLKAMTFPYHSHHGVNALNPPLYEAFIDGYMTLDALGSMTIGLVIITILNNRPDYTETEKHAIARRSILVAGIILFAVYSVLTFMGQTQYGVMPPHQNGIEVLSVISVAAFGSIGIYLIGLIFLLACLNASVGLIAACAEFFSQFHPRITNLHIIIGVALISFCVTNLGLNRILQMSGPLLHAVYPTLIALIFIALIPTSTRSHYRYTIGFVIVFSLFHFVAEHIEVLNLVFRNLPLADIQLEWIVPTLFIYSSVSVINMLKKEFANYRKRKT